MTPLQQSLFPLPPPSQRPSRRRAPSPLPARRRVPLWLAVHLPQLPLETLLRRSTSSLPRAVIESAAGSARIVVLNERASAGGVVAGMSLAAAWALLPQLEVFERDIAREREMLHRLAAWAHGFTPLSCIDEQAVLLEVRGSLRLFGGMAALHGSVRDDLRRFGFTVKTAMAPTPRAALWLARAGREVNVDQLENLPGVLGSLPLPVTGFEPALLDKLRGLGARHLRDLLRLPRDGFARRYSPRALRELDQALGRAPDVRRPLPPPRRFRRRFDLSFEISSTERLLYPLAQLLDELDDYLRTTQQGVNRLQLQLVHRDRSLTPVQLGFADATRDAARIRDLLEQKLEAVELPAPVVEIVLQAQELVELAGRDRALFSDRQGEEDWLQLIERLRVRLGEDAVSSIEQHADHRPERAWRYVAPGKASESSGIPARPCWLLEEPQALRQRDGQPLLDGPLEFLDDAERIETGWWDEADVARDYFTAADVHGRRLWICREVRTGRWWWQGIFE